jgi:hypothetical protein
MANKLEWMPTESEIKNIMCRNVPSRDCDSCKYIGCNESKLGEFKETANFFQTKLLEYLIAYCHNHIGIEVDGVAHTTLTKMLKELEKQQ